MVSGIPFDSQAAILKAEFAFLAEKFGAEHPELRSFFLKISSSLSQESELKEVGKLLTLHLNPAYLRNHPTLLHHLQIIFHHHPEIFSESDLIRFIKPSARQSQNSEKMHFDLIPALIVFAVSPILEAILSKSHAREVCFEDTEHAISDRFIKYLDSGDAGDPQGWAAFKLYKLAREFRTEELARLCLKKLSLYFSLSMDLDELCELWKYAESYNQSEYNWLCVKAAQQLSGDQFVLFTDKLNTQLNQLERVEGRRFGHVSRLLDFCRMFRECRGISFELNNSDEITATLYSMHKMTIDTLKKSFEFFKISAFRASHSGIADEDVEELSVILRESKFLSEVDLSFNKIERQGARRVAEALSDNRFIKKLNLSGNSLGSEGVKHLAESLRTNSYLKELHLAHTHSQTEGVLLLASALEENSSLEILDYGANLIMGFGKMICKNRGLKNLSLRGVVASKEEFRELLRGIAKNQSLNSLDLGENSILSESSFVNLLAEMLKANRLLKSLRLSHIRYSSETFLELVEGMKINETLTSLDLSSNGIDDEGIKGLCLALRDNRSIISLNLHRNGISDLGACLLAEILDENTKPLNAIDLSANQIGFRGAYALLKAFSKKQSLLFMNLSHNQLKQKEPVSLCLKILEMDATISRKNLTGKRLVLTRSRSVKGRAAL